MNKVNEVMMKMIEFDAGDPKRIQHFMKVYEFAKLIGEQELKSEEELFILEVAAIVHDIGIKPSEAKYSACDGKLQEKEGPFYAKELLCKIGISEEVIERVCYLVGHHHTYKNIDGMDYQILVEADFLVNLYEDELPKESVEKTLTTIFKTKTGTEICKTMFLRNNQFSKE